MHHIILNKEAYFGAGCVKKIGDEAVERHLKCAFIVTDRNLIKFGTLAPVIEALQKSNIDFRIFDEVVPNPTISVIQHGVQVFQSYGCDFLVAVGGGSPIDTAKAISIVAANPEYSDIRSLEQVIQTPKLGVILFAVPTTAGTASEVTRDYVITDEARARKFLVADDNCIPRVAFIDARMMMGMPASLAAATGMDALTHAIEAYVSKSSWDMTDIFALKAVECIGKYLKPSCSGLENAREQMALAQYLAGMAFSNAGLGACHALAHPLGGRCHVAHGVANAILLPSVMEFNAPFVGDKFRSIAKALGIHGTAKMTVEQANQAAIDAVRALSKQVGIPQKLSDVHVAEADIPDLARDAVLDACARDNPRPLHTGNAEDIYRKLL